MIKQISKAIQRQRIYKLLKMRDRKIGWTNLEIMSILNTSLRLTPSGAMYNHVTQSTIAARRNEMVADGVVAVDAARRSHKVTEAHKFGTAH